MVDSARPSGGRRLFHRHQRSATLTGADRALARRGLAAGRGSLPGESGARRAQQPCCTQPRIAGSVRRLVPDALTGAR
eukprot:1044824-Prymnesium_polylepis.1